MRKLAYLVAAALLFASSVAWARGSGSSRTSSRSSSSKSSRSVQVKSYTTKSGKVVESHKRSAPNKTQTVNP